MIVRLRAVCAVYWFEQQLDEVELNNQYIVEQLRALSRKTLNRNLNHSKTTPIKPDHGTCACTLTWQYASLVFTASV